MKVDGCLCASGSAELGTVILEAKGSSTIRFLGGTAPANVKPGLVPHTSITLAPRQGDSGLIAVYCEDRDGRGKVYFQSGFFLRVEWTSDGPRVNLDRQFQCRADRLGAIVNHDSSGAYPQIEVTIDGETFTDGRLASGRPGLRYVPDSNLLCRYLIGEVDKEAVITAATEHVEEQSARVQLAFLREEVHQGRLDAAHKGLDEAERRQRLRQWFSDLSAACNSGWRGRQQRIERVVSEFPSH